MKKTILISVFLVIAKTCGAPSIDFTQEMLNLRLFVHKLELKKYDQEMERFINDLGQRESGNNWQSVNVIGCFGEWQFDESTLQYLGYRGITLEKFLSDPSIFPRDMQLRALKALIKVNMMYLLNYEHFIGNTVGGVLITRSGMIAASHLGGAGSLQKFLDSGGEINRKDVFGTSILDYLRNFSNYDIGE
jgi:hypothetical protein